MHRAPIHDVLVHPLKRIPDERGMIMHMMRCTDPHFEKFGEIYFSMAYPGMIKGWHEHTKQTQFYAVIAGMIKLVLIDNRKNSQTSGNLMEIFLGENNYSLVKIPTGVVNGYKNIGLKEAIIANCSDLPHDPTEMLRYDPIKNDVFDYCWDVVMK